MIGARVVAVESVEVHGAQQDITELTMLLDLTMTAVKPRLIVEIGSWKGGSLFAWSATGAEVIAVTLPDKAAEPFNAHNAQVIWGDSHSWATRDVLWRVLAGRVPDLVFVDGDHTVDGCAADVNLAFDIAPGAAVAVHDINLHRRYPEIGVRKVWDAVSRGVPHMVLENDPDTDPGCGIIWPGRW